MPGESTVPSRSSASTGRRKFTYTRARLPHRSVVSSGFLRQDGWEVNHKRIERLWRREGLKVPKKRPKRGRLWLTDGSCVRLRPLRRDHVWAYDFAMVRTADGRAVRILVILDEFTRECLKVVTARRLSSRDVLEALWELLLSRGLPNR